MFLCDHGDCFFPRTPRHGNLPNCKGVSSPTWMQGSFLSLCPLGHHTSQHCTLRVGNSTSAEPSLAELSGVGWLEFCRNHRAVGGNLLLISPVATWRLYARAERSPHHAEHLLQGAEMFLVCAWQREGLCFSWQVTFLSGQGSTEIPLLDRESSRTWQGSVLPKSCSGANGDDSRDGDKMTENASYLVLISLSRGEDEELVLPLIHPFTAGILKGSSPCPPLPNLLLSSWQGNAAFWGSKLHHKSLKLTGLFRPTVIFLRAHK